MAVLSKAARAAKLRTLAEIEGFAGIEDLLERFATDSVGPAICTNAGCDYTAELEPDAREGWCEACRTRTVASALVLAELI